MEYKRLTGKSECGYNTLNACLNCDLEMDCGLCPYWAKALDRLAELEAKIEQGTLIELPCKVGDTVYWLFTTNMQQEIYECYVTEFIYNRKGLDICLSKKCLNGYAYFTLKDIGKTVFLTREEAEKRLKELQE